MAIVCQCEAECKKRESVFLVLLPVPMHLHVSGGVGDSLKSIQVRAGAYMSCIDS